MEKFPTHTFNNLNKVSYTIPRDLEGELNVVAVAFQRHHQQAVNTWLPLLDKLEGEMDEVHYYELPTVRRGNPMFRLYLDNVMRGGIQDTETRERTITLYTDVAAFCEQLQISSDRIYLYLIDREGRIYHREEGVFGAEKGKKLEDAIQKARIQYSC